MVGDGVADRILAAAAHYPREARFYRSLDAVTPAFRAGEEGEARWVSVYRIYP